MLWNCGVRENSWVPWTARRPNQSILKEINPEYSSEGLMLKLQYFGHLMRRTRITGKDPDGGKDWGQEGKGTTEDEMIGWHHRLDGRGFGWTLGVGDGQGGLACCSSWGHRVRHNWETELNWTDIPYLNERMMHVMFTKISHSHQKGKDKTKCVCFLIDTE